MKTPAMNIFRKSAKKTGQYTLIVTFEREHDEDDELVEEEGRTFQQQLRAELQEAYDCGHIAGHFKITSVQKGRNV